MPIPEPPVPLNDICSVIYNNTLYTYSAGAFQALPLTAGAQWATLGKGEPVTGGVCVGSTPKDASKAGLFIVGGKGTTPDYPGLQKFTYATGKWETIKPTVAVTQSRTWHGATYINSTDQILVYAGSQDGSQNPSSQTFTIGASAPHEVLAFESIAPPSVNPMLLPWSESQAVMVGGAPGNTKVMLFSSPGGWSDSHATLAAPLPKDITAVRAVITRGDDGCKNLYTFDMTQSPNMVQRIVLVDSAGKPVSNSAAITARSEGTESLSPKMERKDLTLDAWPSYNATLAPKSTRTNYAVAEDPDGLVVFAGGNPDDVLCMFDARQNSWQNATARLAEQKLLIASEPAGTTSALPSATASTLTSASASSTAGAAPVGAATGGGGVNTNAILGIVLGSITGLMLLLGLILFFVRRHKRKRQHLEAGHMRRASGAPSDEKDNVVFAKDSLAFGPDGHFRGHQNQGSQGSYSSMAILMGRVNQQKPGVGRKPSNDTKRSSSSSIFNKQFKSTISKPMPQLADHPALQTQVRDDKAVAFAANTAEPRALPRGSAAARQGSMRRSSGWNRYWSGGSALNLLGFGASKRTTVESDRSSRYSNMNRITQDSATVPPLHLDARPERPELNRVISGSPTVAQHSSKFPLKEGMSGKIERPVSQASSGYSSGIPESVRDTWDPIAAQKPWGSERAPSSAYSESFYHPTGLAPGNSASGRQQTTAPIGVSRQPQLQMAATSTDMSWLNLGDLSTNSQGRAR